MNHDKATEFFSAYYEDALEGGLRQSFENQLRTDATLQANYAAFVETIENLDALKHEEIEIPMFLSDRIATRLEQVQAKPRFSLPVWTTWIRNVAIGAVAVVAIAVSLPFLSSDKSTATGGFSGTGNVDQILFKADGSSLMLSFQPSGPKTIIVSSPLSGKEIQRFKLNGERLQSPIENSLTTPALFKVEVLNQKQSSLVVVPGSMTLRAKSGEGTIQDLAISLAGFYRVPVVVEASDVTHHISWNFSTPDAVAAANKAVTNEGYSADQTSGGLIKIRDR